METANASALFDFADQIALVSCEVLRYRIKNRPILTDEQKANLENIEIRLDQATARVRADAIAALVAQTEPVREEVESATMAAGAVLRRIKKVERALQVATSVLGLALAAIAGQPKDILAAAKGVKDAVDGNPT
jgi:ferritin-like metal-binding protein YciE